MRTFVHLLVAVALLSGCAAPEPVADAPSTAPAKQLDDGVDKVDVPTLPRDPPKPGERSLDKAPTWRLGEFWEYTVTDGFTGTEYSTTRIVAGTDTTNYLVGFPMEKFDNDILVLHIPGFGDVAQSDLSFEVHDVVFAPLKFPLTVGDTWETAYEGLPVTMAVEDISGRTATITGSGSWGMTITYDADVGEMTKIDIQGYAIVELARHGYNYEGLVRVPHAHDLVFQHGRLAALLSVTGGPGGGPQAPSETVEVPTGYDHLAFTLIAGSAANLLQNGANVPVAGGYYDEKVTAPDNTVYQLTTLPHEQTLKLAFFGSGDPTGTWTLEHMAIGPGIAMAEGIGYHSIDVELPSGCVVNSVNSGHHGASCKVDSAEVGGVTPL
ncbi:MAG: hypothetical protein AABX89_06510 [Candidatus Thermoplasmatota archaeon]